MRTERRRVPRRGLNSLVYLDLEPDNGGILLDLSEHGMQISVANRLVTSSEVRFTLRLQPSEQIQGTGRVAWLSPSGRSAGVHFLDLPDGARREISALLGADSDSSSAEPAQEALQSSAAIASAESSEPVHRAPIIPPIPPAPRVELPVRNNSSSHAAQPSPTPESVAHSAVSPILAPSSTHPQAPRPEPAIEPSPAPAVPPEPAFADPLELLQSAAQTSATEAADPIWTQAVAAPFSSAADGPAEPPPSLLALYGIDGRESSASEPAIEPALAPLESASPQNLPVSARPNDWSADHSPLPRSRSSESEQLGSHTREDRVTRSLGRRSRQRVRRKPSERSHPPILLSPIFVPAPPPYETLDLPEPSPAETYVPAATEADAATEQCAIPESLPEPPVTVSPAPAAPPEPTAEAPAPLPGALYLPNYRIDLLGTPAARPRSRRRFFPKPFFAVDLIFERFEQFGYSLETDWHVWLGLILLFAGFLALAQNPPLIVLTVAFWFASAVMLTERRRPPHGVRRPHGSGISARER